MACLRLLLLIAISPFLFTGCSDSDVLPGNALRGRVLYQSKPVAAGTIVFSDVNQTLTFAPIAADGSYEARLPDGRYAVGVSPQPPDSTASSAMEDFAHVSKTPPPFPTKYNDYQSSGLSVEVAPTKDNVQDIILR